MADNFYISDAEADLLELVLQSELEYATEAGLSYSVFIEDLLDAVKRGDNIRRTEAPRPPQVGNVVHVNFH